jgi:hypothetical protein
MHENAPQTLAAQTSGMDTGPHTRDVCKHHCPVLRAPLRRWKPLVFKRLGDLLFPIRCARDFLERIQFAGERGFFELRDAVDVDLYGRRAEGEVRFLDDEICERIMEIKSILVNVWMA